MNEFKRGFGFGLWIGLILGLLFLYSPARAQTAQQTVTSGQQIQQLKSDLAKTQIVLADAKAERNSLILQIAEMDKQFQTLNNGLKATELILQKAIDNDEKVNFQKLIDLQWNLTLPDSTGTKSKDKPSK